MITTRRAALAALLVTGAAPALGFDGLFVHRARTCPSCLPGLPNSDYQFRSRSASQVIVSRKSVELLPRPSDDRAVKLFQLDRAELTIDHCSVSQVALVVHERGVWTLSLRADQNRVVDTSAPGSVIAAATTSPNGPITAGAGARPHLKRNEFHVRLRCLGAFAETPPDGVASVGKPILAVLEPDAFQVESGQPKWVRVPGESRELRRYFAQVDRVEFEFFYR